MGLMPILRFYGMSRVVFVRTAKASSRYMSMSNGLLKIRKNCKQPSRLSEALSRNLLPLPLCAGLFYRSQQRPLNVIQW